MLKDKTTDQPKSLQYFNQINQLQHQIYNPAKKKQKPTPSGALTLRKNDATKRLCSTEDNQFVGTLSTVQPEVGHTGEKIWNSQHLPDDDAKCDYTKNDNDDDGLESVTHTHTHKFRTTNRRIIFINEETTPTVTGTTTSSYTLNSGGRQPSANRRRALFDFCFPTLRNNSANTHRHRHRQTSSAFCPSVHTIVLREATAYSECRKTWPQELAGSRRSAFSASTVEQPDNDAII